MRDEEKWGTIHAYRRAVSLGEVPAVLCPECKDELVPVVGRDSDPEFKCLTCGTVFDIGLHVYDQIKRNLKESYDSRT